MNDGSVTPIRPVNRSETADPVPQTEHRKMRILPVQTRALWALLRPYSPIWIGDLAIESALATYFGVFLEDREWFDEAVSELQSLGLITFVDPEECREIEIEDPGAAMGD